MIKKEWIRAICLLICLVVVCVGALIIAIKDKKSEDNQPVINKQQEKTKDPQIKDHTIKEEPTPLSPPSNTAYTNLFSPSKNIEFDNNNITTTFQTQNINITIPLNKEQLYFEQIESFATNQVNTQKTINTIRQVVNSYPDSLKV